MLSQSVVQSLAEVATGDVPVGSGCNTHLESKISAMTTGIMNLHDFVEKTSNADPLRMMIGFAAERLMGLDACAARGAAYGEKDPARLAQRKDSRDRD